MTKIRLSETAAAQRQASLNRRHFLRGLGACLALPAFDSLIGSASGAAPDALKNVAASATGVPRRMAFVYVPNGVIQDQWWPDGEGTNFTLKPTLQPLESVKQHLQVYGGLDHVNATAGPDGAGDHARASGTFLTGVRVRKTAGADIKAGVSIDQLVAQQVGHLTRFPSLELTCDHVRKSGNCDSGYSCAYQYNLAWRSESTPVVPEPNPRLVFERLFGAGSPGERKASMQRRQQQQKSILDFVLEDAGDLERQLGVRDQRKLDEYLASVRELEQRIERAERFDAKAPDPAVESPSGIPDSFEEHVRLMFSMMLLAFQTDSTRVATFLLANEGSNRAFPEIGVAEGHHYLSHHQGKQDMIDKIAKIDLFYIQQFAWFLEKLRDTKEVDGTSMLDNSMIVYGSGNSDGNRHTHVNLPILLAGGGAGTLTPGRYVKFPSVPMSNLLLSMADRMGATNLEAIGDSTGRIECI